MNVISLHEKLMVFIDEFTTAKKKLCSIWEIVPSLSL